MRCLVGYTHCKQTWGIGEAPCYFLSVSDVSVRQNTYDYLLRFAIKFDQCSSQSTSPLVLEWHSATAGHSLPGIVTELMWHSITFLSVHLSQSRHLIVMRVIQQNIFSFIIQWRPCVSELKVVTNIVLYHNFVRFSAITLLYS